MQLFLSVSGQKNIPLPRNPETQFHNQFQRADGGVAVILLLRFRQFVIRHQAGMRLPCIITLSLVAPALSHAAPGPYLMHISGHQLCQLLYYKNCY